MRLTGPTLTLRYPDLADAEALLHHASDPDVTKWFSWGPYRHIEEPQAWIAHQQERRESGIQIDFAIEHSEHGVIGITGLTELSARDRRAIVGTWFGREHWGTGANRESKALIAHLAFAVCGMERISAYANPDNGRSVRALEKVGFVHEGTLRRWHRHEGRQLDVDIVGMLRKEWESGELRAEYECAADGEPPAPWLVVAPN
ncbi:MAG: GNAT family protein [Baekduia sp.]